MDDPPDELPAELFVTPPAEFVATRNRIAKELKAAGRSELAARVAKLRRPSATHWALNTAGRSEPDVASAWADSAEIARYAQAADTPTDMREALTALRAATAALVKVAGRHAPVGDVSIALAELASSPERSEALRGGLLGANPNDVPSGRSSGRAAGTTARKSTARKSTARKWSADVKARQRAVDQARSKVDAAAAAMADADVAVESAERSAAAAEAELDAARRAVAAAEAAIADADRRRETARLEQASTAERLERARTLLADAERAADDT